MHAYAGTHRLHPGIQAIFERSIHAEKVPAGSSSKGSRSPLCPLEAALRCVKDCCDMAWAPEPPATEGGASRAHAGSLSYTGDMPASIQQALHMLSSQVSGICE